MAYRRYIYINFILFILNYNLFNFLLDLLSFNNIFALTYKAYITKGKLKPKSDIFGHSTHYQLYLLQPYTHN